MAKNSTLLVTVLFSLLLISSYARIPFNIEIDIPKPESTKLNILSDTSKPKSTEMTIVSDAFKPKSTETNIVSDVSILPSSEYDSLTGLKNLEVPEIEIDTTTVYPDVVSNPTFLRLRPMNPQFRPMHHHRDHRRPPFWLRFFQHRPCHQHHHHHSHDHEHHNHGEIFSGYHFPGKRIDWVNSDELTRQNFYRHVANRIFDQTDNNQEIFEHVENRDRLNQPGVGHRYVEGKGQPWTHIDFDSEKKEISYGNDMVMGDHESNDRRSVPRVVVRRVDSDEMELFGRLEYEEMMPEREGGYEGGILGWVQKFLNRH